MPFTFEPCPEEHAFYFANGARARSLAELRASLDEVPVDVLDHHRGHFHMWVRDVLDEPQLADRLREVGERAPSGDQLRRDLDNVLDNAIDQAREGPPTRGTATRGRARGGETAAAGGKPVTEYAARPGKAAPGATETTPGTGTGRTTGGTRTRTAGTGTPEAAPRRGGRTGGATAGKTTTKEGRGTTTGTGARKRTARKK